MNKKCERFETADDPDSSGLIVERVGNTFLVLEAKVWTLIERKSSTELKKTVCTPTEPV